ESEVVGRHFDLTEVLRANGAVLDGELVLLARAVVGESQGVRHGRLGILVFLRLPFRVLIVLRVPQRLAWNAVGPICPACQILHAAPFAAERPPRRVHGVLTTKRANGRHAGSLYLGQVGQVGQVGRVG